MVSNMIIERIYASGIAYMDSRSKDRHGDDYLPVAFLGYKDQALTVLEPNSDILPAARVMADRAISDFGEEWRSLGLTENQDEH